MADLGEVGTASVGLRADGTKLKGDLDEARKQTGKAGKKTGTLYAQEFGRSATSGFKTALAGLVSLVAVRQLGQAFLRAALPFNAALAETTTLIDGTVEQTEFLRDSAREMAREFGGTGADQVRAFYQAISAGAGTVEEAATLLGTANRFAIGGVTDLVTSIDVLTTATNAYSRANLTAADAADILFVGIRAGKTTAAELGGAIGKAASLASDAGVSFKELVAATAALTTTGISTREAITGMRAILAAIVKPSSEAAKLAKALGLEFSVAGLKAKGFEAFLADLIQKTGGSVEVMAQLFGGVEALAPVISLTGAVADKFAETMDDMADASGSAQVAFDKVSASLTQRLNVVLGRMNVSTEKAGTALLQILVPALEATADNIRALGNAMLFLTATQVPRLIGMIGSLVSTLFSAGAAFKFLGGPVGILVGAFALLVTNLNSLARAMGITDDASEKLTIALGEEIVQSQLLTTALNSGAIVSLEVAEAKLKEAKARLVNVKAILAEQSALQQIESSIQTEVDLIASVSEVEARFQTDFDRATLKGARATLDALRAEKQARIEQNEDVLRVTANIEKLEAAIANAEGGRVSFGGVVPIVPGAGGGGLPGDGADAPSTPILDAIEDQIDAEARLREEIGATIATLGEEEGARERLLSQIELDRVARELDAAAIAATTEEQREEIRQARELLPVLRAITDARLEDERALGDQENALADAEEAQRAYATAIKSSADQLIRASLEGGNFIEILANLALKLIEIKALQFAGGQSGGGGGGILGTIAGAVLGGLAGGIGGGGGSLKISEVVPKFAEGGLPPVGQFSLVGERGPELAFFGSAARVFSNEDLQSAVHGAGGGVKVQMNITTPDVGGFRRSQSQLSAELGRMIRQGQARQT